ncbi:CBO0543 family protein [Cytobacillus sp. FSL H8-0458]|uniref:CBO0543 family protein n=1 Tax=Cytobacillus sp. FSL H8-0458 TaxID=2975346 RepID=UPI0030F8801A
MGRKFERNLLRSLFMFGIGAFFHLVRKPPIKDWLIVFFLKSYIATFLDNLLVRKGYLKYPVNLFKTFDVSVLFSYIIFPITCVYFNQQTRNSGLKGILLKSLIFSIPSAIAEHFLEKHTQLIKYKKSWNSYYSFISIMATFLLTRGIMGVISKSSEKQKNPAPKH